MRIDVHDHHRQPLFKVDVDPASPPTVARSPEGGDTAIHLDWDRALDDERHLRHCPVCGCSDLFVHKRFPQVTAFSLIVLAALLAMALFGFGQWRLALLVLVIVAVIDLLIYLLPARSLVCYRCRSEFSGIPISRHHEPWRAAIAEKYPHPDKTQAPSRS